MKVTLVAQTSMQVDRTYEITGDRWVAEDDHGSDLAEFAGRACYQSWSRPNPATADNAGYLGNIIRQEHYSVMEHGSMTFYIENVSRSLTHELVRHRHFSYSQLSQRFVTIQPKPASMDTEGDPVPYIIPPAAEGIAEANAVLSAAWDYATHAYSRLLSILDLQGITGKKAKEAARAVLPNMTPTAIVVTGNHRAWREFLVKRGSLAADAEIRRLAIAIFRLLDQEEHNLYQDFTICNTGEPEGQWLSCDPLKYDEEVHGASNT
jgi:thymidylate synthase (FAD)